MVCKCYHANKNFLGGIGVCWGTKEREACSCGGDEAKCDFYDYVRERAKSLSQKQTNADHIRVMTDGELVKAILAYNCLACPKDKKCRGDSCEECWLLWLKEEYKD